MPKRIMRAAALLASWVFLVATTGTAQEKAAPRLLPHSTASEAANAALNKALVEVENFGGVQRVDPGLQAVLDADQGFALGRAYYGGWKNGLTAAERHAELTRALKDAADASTAELLFISAVREWRAGRPAVARDLLDVVMRHAPDDPHVAWLRMLLAANPEDALRVGEAAARAFPDYGPVLNMLAYRLNTAGRKDEAYRTIQKYIAVLPDHPNPHDSYAEILQLNGRLDEAATHYAHALEKEPAFEAAHEGMAEIEVLRGNYAAARVHLEAALKDAATPARSLVLQREKAATLLYEHKLKEARRVLQNVVAQAESNGLGTNNDQRSIAFITLFEGNTAQAQQQYTAAALPEPGATMPLTDAIFYLLSNQPAEVARAVAAMEANAAQAPNVMDTQQAARAARVLAALARGDVAAAQTAHADVTGAGYRALTASFLVRALNKAGDRTAAQTLLAEVDAHRAVNLNAGFTRVIARRK